MCIASVAARSPSGVSRCLELAPDDLHEGVRERDLLLAVNGAPVDHEPAREIAGEVQKYQDLLTVLQGSLQRRR